MQAAIAAPRLALASAAARRPTSAGSSSAAAGGRRRLAVRLGALGGQQDAAERRHRAVADLSDDEYMPSDAEADIPMSQRLTARDTYRAMKGLGPEFPPEPEPDNPDAHTLVSELASDEEALLPDDPLALDEELIMDHKPFIQDVYDDTAGTQPLRKRKPAAAAASSASAPVSGPAVSNLRAPSRMAAEGGGEGAREERKAQAEEEVTMKPGGGQQVRGGGEGGSGAPPIGRGAGPISPTKAPRWASGQPLPVSGAAVVRGAAKAQQQAYKPGPAPGVRAQMEAGSLKEGGPAVPPETARRAAEEAGEGEPARGTGGQGEGAGAGASSGQAREPGSGLTEQEIREAAERGETGVDEEERARRRAYKQMGGDRPERAGLSCDLDRERRLWRSMD